MRDGIVSKVNQKVLMTKREEQDTARAVQKVELLDRNL